MATIKQTASAASVPTGEYAAKFTEFEETEGQFGPQLKASLEIVGGEFAGQRLTTWASMTFSPKSKLYSWALAAFGKDIPANYDLNTDHLLNKTVIAVVVVKPGKDGTGEFSRVDNVKARKNGATAAPRPAPVAAPVPAPVAQAESEEIPF